MKRFIYNQNNSFGVYQDVEWDGHQQVEVDGYNVTVIAPDHEEANSIAEKYTSVYFDSSMDCPCCGSRWSRHYDSEPNDWDILEVEDE